MSDVPWQFIIILLCLVKKSQNSTGESIETRILQGNKGQFMKGSQENQYFELNRTAVAAYWHNVLMRALIKAKLNREKVHLSRVDSALADICLEEAKTLMDRLQCLDNVLMKRDATNSLHKDLCSGVPETIEVPSNESKNSVSMTFFRMVKMRFRRLIYPSKKHLQTHKIQKKSPLRRLVSGIYRISKKSRKKKHQERRLEKHLSTFLADHYRYPKESRKSPNERGKRAIPPTAKLKDLPENYNHFGKDVFEMIAEIDEHERKVEKINGFWKLVTKTNSKLLNTIDKKIEVVAPRLTSRRKIIDAALAKISHFQKDSTKTSAANYQTASVLSPRFFSFSNSEYTDILSPKILGLRPGGILSLHDLGKTKGAINLSMAKFLLEISGAGKAVRNTYSEMEPEIRKVKVEVYPDTIELARHTLNWIKARKLMNQRQLCEMKNYGYTHMTPKQIELVYNKANKFSQELPMNMSEYGRMDQEARERRVEYMLSNMLYLGNNMNETIEEVRFEDQAFVLDNVNMTGPLPPSPQEHQLRFKRDSPEEGPPGFQNRTNGILLEVLRPYAFDVLSGLDAYLEALVLSPSAFTLEIFQPELLVLGLLSPRAFAAIILSPGALIARILSPMTFKFEVLAPRALSAWVLSPEGFVADILTPTFLEPRVLSPIGMFLSVLSPNILGPHVGGTDNLGFTVLSPNILSPRFLQRERLMIEVLSPHILGGEHIHAHHRGGHEPEEDNDEPAAGGHAAIEMVDLHGLAHDVDDDDPITLEKILGRGEEWAENEIMPDDRHLMEFLGIPLPPSQAAAHLEHIESEAAAGDIHAEEVVAAGIGRTATREG